MYIENKALIYRMYGTIYIYINGNNSEQSDKLMCIENKVLIQRIYKIYIYVEIIVNRRTMANK